MVGKVRSMDTITKHQNHTEENFVTVVSVGSEPSCVLKTKCDTFTPVDPNSSGYITVLTIGDSAQDCVANEDVIEEVLVYRLPGERLGFGLKFEGGTKANEFVKRLFIQSCAPDSPASRVQCSWGKLSEGDEVLEIDSMSVNTMTRIDCVRCLKDSNVVIKLLVRHFISKKPTADGKQLCDKTRSVEDLPQVISAEKKRTPPPPPPVPPRKIPKKFYKNFSNNHSNINNSAETSAQFSRQINTEVTINVKSKKFQSPRSSGKSSYSPDIPRRDRRFSDGSIGPPDAEVYVDLFSQESMQNLSESDDTGSSISTVVDRFASFPTTTTSSFAGSLPSTPTSIQKHIDFSNLLNSYDDDELTLSFNANNNEVKANIFNNKNVEHAEKQKDERSYETVNEDGTPLQPPSCFQDAPLSYGNEDMRIIESKSNEINKLNLPKSLHLHQQTYPDIQDDKHCENNVNSCNEEKIVKKPPVPPRSRDLINTHIKLNSFKEFHNNNNNIHDENMNISNLPRLVDFVPKSVRKNYENPVEIINVFLENERKDSDYYKTDYYEEIDDPNLNVYTNDMDIYSSKWSLSSQLATIGEDEEEGNQDVTLNRSPLNSTPIVIVENADNDIQSGEQCLIAVENHQQNQNQVQKGISTNGKMDGLTSDSRQPPDGHESPDYIETKNIEEKFNNNNAKTDLYNDSLAMNMKNVNSSQIRSSLSDLTSTSEMNNHRLLIQNKNSVSAMDLSSTNLNLYSMQNSKLHQNIITQSLLGLSTMNSEKKERLTLSDQRKQTHSKLKGLVIPEHVSDLNVNPVVNIPEIISHNQPSFVLEAKVKPTSETMQCHANDNNASEPVALPLLSPPWALNATTLPKYSPAFKRKSLQVYPVKDKKHYNEPQSTAIKTMPIQNVTNSCATLTKSKLANSELRIDNLFDAPKSLESITSPTRSDCSFDYVTNTFNKVKANQQESSKVYMTRKKKDSNKSEEDSDNDSALSSSQSSFVSRSSPPPSPTRSCESVDYDNNKRKSDWIQDESCRLLKAASVEAINRKNILASAKCRSGKDLTGSPVIQRKYEEDGDNEANDKDNANNNEAVGTSADSSSSAHSTTINSLIDQPVNILNQQENNSSSSAHVVDENLKENEPNVLPKAITKAKGKQKTSNDTKSIKQVEHTTLVKLKPVLNIPKLQSSMTTTSSTNYSLRSSLLLKNNNNRMSVTDIRKNFEKPSVVPLPKKIQKSSLLPMKSPKSEVKTLTTNVSNTSISSKPKESTEVSKLKSHKNQTVQTKKATSSTPTEKVIANNVKSNSNNPSNTKNSRKTIVLCPEILGGSTGLTLAGGTDYETKEITVHRIRYGSVAYNNGKLKKGDRIISINGKDTNGLTHAQSVELLKKAVAEYELVVEDGVAESPTTPPQKKSFIYETPSPKSPTLSKKTANHVVTLVKDGAGLGFSIDGGKGSLHGDLPLRIKKIFQGGTADKCGELVIGDELLAINDISLSDLSKIEAWNLMKKIPDGQVSIHINR